MSAQNVDSDTPREGPRFVAAVDMLRRSGATTFQIRYCEEEQPVVWMAVVGYVAQGNPKSGDPSKQVEREVHDAAAGMTPVHAALRLCEQLIDGGTCTHCHRPTGFDADSLDAMPADRFFCWYQWDPEMATFRRGCEGDQ